MLGGLRAQCSECSSRGRWLVALSLVVACTDEGHYFDDPPEPRQHGGAGSGAAGSTSTGAGAGTATGGQGGAAGFGAVAGTNPGGSGASGGSGTAASAGDFGVGGSAGAGLGGVSGAGIPGSGGTNAGDAGDTGTAGEDGEPCVPSPERCDGVSNDCDDAIDEDDACPAGCSAKTREGHLYLLCVAPDAAAQRDYSDASDFCEGAGEELGLGVSLALARIESAEESVFARAWADEVATETGSVWLGANDSDDENTWVWGRGRDAVQFFTGRYRGGGTPYMNRYNDFADGRPDSPEDANQDCGAMSSELAWQWDDFACGTPRLGELCEELP